MSTASKVAQVTLLFWVMKICATTLGETSGDLLSTTLGLGYAASTLILLGCFAATLSLQLACDRFVPSIYWLVILSTSMAGTTLSDFMDRTLGLGYATGSGILVGCLALVLATWRFFEGSLSVQHIASRRAELFYWAAILVSNTLGTALGDFLADESGLGFLGGALLIGAAIAIVAVCAAFTRIDRVLLFWIAFVLTRPFGATFGDLLTKTTSHGGFDLGTIGASAVLASLLLACVVYVSAKRDEPPDTGATR